MKVLVTTGIFPPDIGGPATFVPHLAMALHERGHDVTVLTLSEVREDNAFPFHVIRIPRSWPIIRRLAETMIRIARMARSADVLFANGLFDETAIAASVTRTPWVAKVVGDWVWERARNRRWTRAEILPFQGHELGRARLHRLVQRAVIARAKRVIVPSAYLRNIVLGWGVGSDVIRVVPNAVLNRPCTEKKHLRPELGIRESMVLTAGRLVSWKGVDGIIRAVSGLPVLLVVAGDGPDRRHLERLAASLGSSVQFLGPLQPDVLWRYLCAADVFVLNSTYEGFPHVALEAMAAGAVVAATRAGGIPELIQDGVNGVLVPPQDVEALRATLVHLLASTSDRERLSAAAQRTATQYTVGSMTSQIESVLHEAMLRP